MSQLLPEGVITAQNWSKKLYPVSSITKDRRPCRLDEVTFILTDLTTSQVLTLEVRNDVSTEHLQKCKVHTLEYDVMVDIL